MIDYPFVDFERHMLSSVGFVTIAVTKALAPE